MRAGSWELAGCVQAEQDARHGRLSHVQPDPSQPADVTHHAALHLLGGFPAVLEASFPLPEAAADATSMRAGDVAC